MLLGKKSFGGENQRRGLRLATEQQRCGKIIPTGVLDTQFNAPYCYFVRSDGMRG